MTITISTIIFIHHHHKHLHQHHRSLCYPSLLPQHFLTVSTTAALPSLCFHYCSTTPSLFPVFLTTAYTTLTVSSPNNITTMSTIVILTITTTNPLLSEPIQLPIPPATNYQYHQQPYQLLQAGTGRLKIRPRARLRHW